MQFTKMHGAGNDYVYVDTSCQPVDDPAGVARAISDRHFGVGSDGLVLIAPHDDADVAMRMFNADGSEGAMCGNAIRCVAKYAWEHHLSRANPMRIHTRSGIKTLDLAIHDDRVQAVTADMGAPELSPQSIPANIPGDRIVDHLLDIDGPQDWPVTCVSMGNPHAVTFMDGPDALAALPIERIGPKLETHPAFPGRVNVHFVVVNSPTELTMRTWERGSGETLACGTGASAVCVAGVLTDRCQRNVLIHLPGGDLNIHWQESDNHVLMTGPAEEVFCGEWTPASMEG